MNGSMRIACAAAAALTTLTVATACGGTHPSTAQGSTQFAEMFEGYRADYDPASSPAELAAGSDLVVQGRVGQVVPGLTFSDALDDSLTYQGTILQFKVDDVLAGRVPPGAGQMVYVELPAPYGYTAEEFDRAAPKDAPAVLYLVELPDPREWTEKVLNPAAGRPAGQPVMTVTSPQGFIVSAGEDETVIVLEYPGHPVPAPLERFLPTAEPFPDTGGHDRGHDHVS